MNPIFKAILPTDRLPHVWQVLATLLAVAATFVLCWYLSQKGLLDLAATGVSFYIVTFLRQLAPSLARKAPKELKRTAGLIDTAREDFAMWMANRKLLSLALIALAVTVMFLVFRYIASVVMVAIASPWLALAVGLALAAAVASPVMVKGIVHAVTKGYEPASPPKPDIAQVEPINEADSDPSPLTWPSPTAKGNSVDEDKASGRREGIEGENQ